jgi:oligoendopeptidase F
LRRESALHEEYVRITAAQTVIWDGRETGVRHLQSAGDAPDRRTRERAWRLAAERELRDRETIGALWAQLLQVRQEQTALAGFPDYLACRSEGSESVSETREQHHRFHLAVEEWVTPVVVRLHEERRVQLGLRRFQPWDLPVDPAGLIPPCDGPYPSVMGDERSRLVQRILHRLPVAAMADAFEQWAYADPEQASDVAECGRQWHSLWLRFLPGVDWTGLDQELEAEWQRHAHLFLWPLTAIEVASAQIGAIQVWAQERQGDALACFEKALAHGGLSGLSGAAMLDEHTIREAVEAIEEAL